MAVQMDAAVHNALTANKRANMKHINALTKLLYKKCAICWAWKDHLTEKSSGHLFFIHCRDPHEILEDALRWMALKKNFRYKKFAYCWMCGLPQEEYLPNHHPAFKKGQRVVCPFEDLVAGICMFIRVQASIFSEACKNFPGLKPHMSMEEFIDWANREESAAKFNNGLELVIWYWKYKTKQI